jgi:hypothetical protein
LAALLAEIRWQTVRRAQDNRSAGRAATCPVLAAEGQALEIAPQASEAQAAQTVVVEVGWEVAEATASETAAFLPVAATEARSVADRPASADRVPEQTARVALRALAAVAAAAAAAAGVVVAEGAGNRA